MPLTYEPDETGSRVPNLDCQEPEDLMAFWSRHQAGRRYRLIFPDGGRGRKRATADLANYASNKATAVACRLRGEINTAGVYEAICERIYNGLPQWARW